MTDDGPRAYPCPHCGERTRLIGGWPADGGRERSYKCVNNHWFSTLETVAIPFCGKIGETAEAWNQSKPAKED